MSARKKNKPVGTASSVNNSTAAANSSAVDENDDDEDSPSMSRKNRSKRNKDSLSVSGQASTMMSKKQIIAEEREWKRRQEAVFREVEQSLIRQFETSSDPYMLNLILIENSRDYGVNKYNTLACVVAKSFEKWAVALKVLIKSLKNDKIRVFFELFEIKRGR